MTIELHVLAWSVVLGFVHLGAASHAAARQRSYRWAASPRDTPMPPLTGAAGRLERAAHNFRETFPLFAAAVLAAHAAGVHDAWTRAGVLLYFSGRVLYLPAYVLGIPLLRSLIWNVATLGIVVLLMALLSAAAA